MKRTVTNKTGWLYVSDRVTGQPIWPIEERPVPKSEMEGEASWPTSPIRPTRRSMSSTFGIENISPYLSPEEADAIKKRLLAAKNGAIFAPIGLTDTVWVPASNGGTIFSGSAADPRAGFVYLVAHENPGIVRLLPPGTNAGRGAAGPIGAGQLVYQQQCQVCHGPERRGTDMGVPLVLRDRRSPE